jgi:hypothetical protein
MQSSHDAMMTSFERRKAAYQAFVEKQAGPLETTGTDEATTLNSGFRY